MSQDTKCAPNIKYTDGSCFTYDVLQDMTKNYNKKITDPADYIDYKLPKADLVKSIKYKLQNECADQICWLRELIVDKISKNILTNTFRPLGPKGKYDWLSTSDINNVMNQYVKLYNDFSYLGTVPYDFESLKLLEFHNKNIFDNYYRKGKTKLGMIINLDTHDMNGSHWVALYTDLKNNQVYFFDSGGNPPGKRICKFINRIVTYIYNRTFNNEQLNINKIIDIIQNNNNPSYNHDIKKLLKIDIKYNNIQHQFNNSECGVYSINFILRLLEKESQQDIINNVVLDHEMNKNRKIYFRNAN